jgi:hypothetical protein
MQGWLDVTQLQELLEPTVDATRLRTENRAREQIKHLN